HRRRRAANSRDLPILSPPRPIPLRQETAEPLDRIAEAMLVIESQAASSTAELFKHFCSRISLKQV
ncbi:MAG TPA: hypothetical protein VHP80_07130, partial [Candidatus Acidoferrum sp.]|nr:hypothetical protein [Candidatus Acidoferrum sp.]